ncbi:pilus assembly protein PilX [Psychrobacter sp. AOP7-D1-21]|uniref:pilus assembly protein PilX n=1 Tax=Psychrobacter sp. AOP7-D1-21 TaxID=3457636 RepID=UPI003FB7BF3F
MTIHRYPSSLTVQDARVTLRCPSTERGATLIVVLLFLVLIMLAGAIAVRQSNTDLKIATSDQINTVLLQSSDSANQKLEMMINGSSTSTEYRDVTSASGVFGHFLLDDDNATNEFIYCFNPRTKRYLASNATVMVKGTVEKPVAYWSGLKNGVCDYNSAEGYTSARQAVVTQMSVTVAPADPNDERFAHVVIGKEIEDRTSKKFTFDIRAASALPSYSEPKANGDNCFAQTSIDTNVVGSKKSLSDCMLEAGTPSKMLYEQADVENLSSSTKCTPFGRGTFNTECVLKATS